MSVGWSPGQRRGPRVLASVSERNGEKKRTKKNILVVVFMTKTTNGIIVIIKFFNMDRRSQLSCLFVK